MNHPLTIPHAEPFFFKGGPIGCLLIHGFTGTPNEMRWMGEYLASQGFTVLAPRLFAHGTQPDDMLRARWWDWLASVEDGLHLLKSCTDQQVTMGLSMGAVLSLMAAARYPIAGAVSISCPFTLGDDPRLPLVKYIYPLMPRHGKGEPDWQGTDGAEGHIDYPYYPTRAIAELNDLLAQMRKDLPAITKPVLLVHSRKDRGIPLSNLESIRSALTSPAVSTLVVENSGHVIPREPDRQQVFEAAAAFARQAAAKA